MTSTAAPTVPVGLSPDGELFLAGDVHEVDRRDDPLALEPGGTSVALVVERDGAREWWLLAQHPDGSTTTLSVPEGRGFPRFDQWLQVQVAWERGDGPVSPVVFTDDGGLQVTDPNATMLAQLSDLDLGPGFAHPGSRTAVAKVQHQGVVWFVLAREHDGAAEYVPTLSDATTIGDYLLEARRWYAG